MTIKEFQAEIADALNADETLQQGYCKALAEDTLSIVADVQEQLATVQGVALVVTTPELSRNGVNSDDTIPAETTIEIKCVEIPAVNREAGASHMTAMSAAQRVIHCLNDSGLWFDRLRQSSNNGALTVSVSFKSTINL